MVTPHLVRQPGPPKPSRKALWLASPDAKALGDRLQACAEMVRWGTAQGRTLGP